MSENLYKKLFTGLLSAVIAYSTFNYVIDSENKRKIEEFLKKNNSVQLTREDIEQISHLTSRSTNSQDSLIIANAWNYYPKSRPYLEQILIETNNNKRIFDFPLEYTIATAIQESNFSKHAVSISCAIGVWQFTRIGGENDKVSMYSPKDFPKLYFLETKLKKLNDSLSVLDKVIKKNFSKNDFKIAEKQKLAYDKLRNERTRVFEAFRQEFHRLLSDDLFLSQEKRIDVGYMTPIAIKRHALDARELMKHFNSSKEHSAIRALAAYNAGLNSSKKWYGIPNILETNDYIRRIMCYSDTLRMKNLQIRRRF